MKILSLPEYEAVTAGSRDRRMSWWRDARFGMFVHYGLYSVRGRHEWSMVYENTPIKEYEKLAEQFKPRREAPHEWAALAKKAGMKYMVMTTRHHEGFSLWNSKVNPYNSYNYSGVDVVKEFVEACRENDLGIGFYSSLMDWHHPDGYACAYDQNARRRFTDYIEALNTELLSNYGKIDILWYDVARPMKNYEGWNSLERNQHLRALQPDLIINNRSLLPEDFGTPEEHVTADSRDWEACMTFNGISWGYIDQAQTAPYAYNGQRILQMLNKCCAGGGNLLLNIGPQADGSVPEDAVKPLTEVGDWLRVNGEAVYGKMKRELSADGSVNYTQHHLFRASGKDNKVYLWFFIWPQNGEIALGGYDTAPKSVRVSSTGENVPFEFRGQRIILHLPKDAPDKILNVSLIEMEFDKPYKCCFASYYPQLHEGQAVTENRI